ncbi:MAG: Hpt domain-containing protein [Candidatus Omnitrophica bacterium]|nr:Hpt domain-containing protein [Candidatus Omnitrophota bacterium]
MSQVIDVKDVLERVQGDKEFMLELFDIFMEDFTGKRDTFWKAFEKHDTSGFQMIAHGLKGATGNISAAQMHDNCVALDLMGKDGDISNARPALELLDRQFAEFKIEAARLKAEIQKQ